MFEVIEATNIDPEGGYRKYTRDGDHRALSAQGELRRRGSGGNTPGRGFRPPGGRHYRSPLGNPGEPLFPSEHWKRLRTNNALERFNREIRRRTKVIGDFQRRGIRPDARFGPSQACGLHYDREITTAAEHAMAEAKNLDFASLTWMVLLPGLNMELRKKLWQ